MSSVYLCIDLKSFFASVECVERGYDPFEVSLVVADPSRGKGALCLAISPKLKSLGVRNRCRLFEIPKHIPYEVALPRMQKYIEYSAMIYGIYLKYVSKEDIHVYSIDEAFLDVTHYLKLYEMNAKELVIKITRDIYETTGITATVGIGTNLYLAKVALDITAKHVDDHIGILTESLYKEKLWHHKPLTDFWQIGHGIMNRLSLYGIDDMYGIAHAPEQLLYKEFGINAELMIDHALGKESTTIKDIKCYKPKHNSLSRGQVLFEDYNYEDALLVVKEMVELLTLDLVDQHLVSNHIYLHIGYSNDMIKSTGGSRKIGIRTNSYTLLLKEFIQLYKATTYRNYPIRRINIAFGQVVDEHYEYYNLFIDYDELKEERELQRALIKIKNKYGKNSILKGMNLSEKATTTTRNTLIGGHNAK